MVSERGKRRIRRGGRITIDARDGSRNSTQKSSRVGLKSEKSIKRYVNHWFKTISDDDEVPNAVPAGVMDDAFLELEKRATRNINLPKLLLSDLPSILQDAFEMYREGKAMIGGGDDDALLSMNKDVVDESPQRR